MRLEEFNYELPEKFIAQQPLAQRDASRMLWLRRQSGVVQDRWFRELPDLLLPGDLLVANESRVIPARLLGRRHGHSGLVKAVLLEEVEQGVWDALLHPSQKCPVGERLEFGAADTPDLLAAEIIGRGSRGQRRLRFHWQGEWNQVISRFGHVPLPPYIKRPDTAGDQERYQTVYAQSQGSAAAPTAGLHFTPGMLDRLRERGMEWATVTLHVGLGTFQPVEHENIEEHPMHRERYAVSESTAAALRQARAQGRRIIAVGTTAARVLETVGPEFPAGAGETKIFLHPGGRGFGVVDAMLTNFHAPRSTLLMMIAAFAGLENVRGAYRHAIAAGYRFLSYGDCMLIS